MLSFNSLRLNRAKESGLTCKLKFDCDSTELQGAERLHEIASACADQVLETECTCYPVAQGWVGKLGVFCLIGKFLVPVAQTDV